MASAPNLLACLSEVVCGPCNKTRIMAQAKIHCPVCKEVFCYNCSKIHKMKESSRNHNTNLLSELDSSALRNIIHKITIQHETTRASRRLGVSHANVESKSRYMEQLAITHDHDEIEVDNELFCMEHTLVICDQCGSSHLQCAGICSLDQIAITIREKGELTKLSSKYKQCQHFASILYEDRQKEKQRLDEFKEKLLLQNRQIVETNMKCLEQETESEIMIGFQCNLDKVKAHEEKCSRIQMLTKRALEDLQNVSTQPRKSLFVKTYYQLKNKYIAYENCLKEIYDEIRLYKYHFQSNKFVASLPDELKSVEVAQNIIEQKRLPSFLSTENFKRLDGKGLQRNKSIKLWGLGIYARAGITALKCSSGSNLVAVNRTESEVRIFDLAGWTVANYELSSLPWDLALLSDTRFVVTMPGEHKVVFFKLDRTGQSKLIIEKELDVTEECWGIEAIGTDKFVGTFEPWTKRTSVKIFNGYAKIETVVKENDSGENIFRAPQHIICDKNEKKIYVSDSGLNAVITFDLKGQVLSIFSDPLLNHPTGITLDHEGNLYVCGKTSENIVKIPYTSGRKVTDILDSKYAMNNPRAICFDPDGNNLLVACSGKAEIFRFKMS